MEAEYPFTKIIGTRRNLDFEVFMFLIICMYRDILGMEPTLLQTQKP